MLFHVNFFNISAMKCTTEKQRRSRLVFTHLLHKILSFSSVFIHVVV